MEGQAHGLLSMPGVGFLGMLVIGILAGWIAEKITSSDHGLLTNLLVGIAGSFVGGTLASLLNIEFYGWLGNLLVASIGATCYGFGGPWHPIVLDGGIWSCVSFSRRLPTKMTIFTKRFHFLCCLLQ
jgi:uncharacterized membrane protein YeaQ/YmgE (transglycosylase-associated protein family)